jgi:hypothetical protein
MKPRIDLHILHFANHEDGFLKESRIGMAKFVRVSRAASEIALRAVLPPMVGLTILLAASPISAQQDWPPDEPGNAPYTAAPQPNATAPQYAYGQPRYPQQPVYPAPGYQQQTQSPYAQQGYGQQLAQTQPLSPEQLTQLLAPIALYPDGLVAQILAASTYPAQVAAADQWLQSIGNAPPDQIAAGANAQSSWDPSVKALTAFPQVMAMLAGNLPWTTALGNAYYN